MSEKLAVTQYMYVIVGDKSAVKKKKTNQNTDLTVSSRANNCLHKNFGKDSFVAL